METQSKSVLFSFGYKISLSENSKNLMIFFPWNLLIYKEATFLKKLWSFVPAKASKNHQKTNEKEQENVFLMFLGKNNFKSNNKSWNRIEVPQKQIKFIN